MKHIFLFVNPSSGGNKASLFTELGIKEIIFHKPEVCHVFIYNILDGEKGKKPGFINLSSVIKNNNKKNENNEQLTDYIYRGFKSSGYLKREKNVTYNVRKANTITNKSKENENVKTSDYNKVHPAINIKNSLKNEETFDQIKNETLTQKQELSIEQNEDIYKEQNKEENNKTVVKKKKVAIQRDMEMNRDSEKHKEKLRKSSMVKGEGEGEGEGERTEKEEELKKKRDINGENSKELHIYVLVAGGDGTINWVLKECENYDISNDDFAIGVIPFGTGNDFARAFGWKKIGSTLNHEHLIHILKKIVEHAFKAKLEKHDYWNIVVTLKDDGYFNKINSKTKKKETLKENDENIKILNLHMSNYFSIGIDSRIGRGFERHRKKNAVCNKMVYAIEGFKKVTFKKTIPVNSVIDKMVKGKHFNEVVFTTNSSVSNSHNYPTLKNAVSIVCINIPSFSSGNDIWHHTHKLGLKLPNNVNNQVKKNYEELKHSVQKSGDGLLEFVIYQSGIDLGLEYTLKGRAYRIHQGEGPWKLFFKDQKCNVYFQVDGEFYLMSLPNFICIEHYKKVNVLKNILEK